MTPHLGAQSVPVQTDGPCQPANSLGDQKVAERAPKRRQEKDGVRFCIMAETTSANSGDFNCATNRSDSRCMCAAT